MKKIFGLIIFVLSFSCARVMAQQTEIKVKPQKTMGDRVHNTIHPRHRRHHGYKVKRKTEKSAFVRPKELEVGTV